MSSPDPFASPLPSSLVTESVALDELHGDPANARKHNARNLEAISDSLREFGQVEPLVVQANTGTVVGGNGRLEAMRKMGWKTASVVRIDLSSTQATALSIALNRTGELGTWDTGILSRHLNALDLSNFDIGHLHFDTDLLGDSMEQTIDNLASQDTDGTKGSDAIPDVVDTAIPDEPVLDEVPEADVVHVKRGQIYNMGQHRLFCGDSSVKDNIDILLAGETPSFVFTDPPYGMNLDTNYSQMHGKGLHASRDYKQVIGDDQPYSPSHIFEHFPKVKEIILWGADYYCQLLPVGGSWYCWDKRCGENLDKLFGNSMELAWSLKRHKREVARVVWSGHLGMHGEDSGKRLHPTQKPIKLIRWFFQRIKGDIVVDLFAGSGSTLIACEKEGRRCFAAEIDPHYCQVIINRWQHITGQEAALEQTIDEAR